MLRETTKNSTPLAFNFRFKTQTIATIKGKKLYHDYKLGSVYRLERVIWKASKHTLHQVSQLNIEI